MKDLKQYILESIDPDDTARVKKYFKTIEDTFDKLAKLTNGAVDITHRVDKGGTEVYVDIHDCEKDNVENFKAGYNEALEWACDELRLDKDNHMTYDMFWDNSFGDDSTVSLSCLYDVEDMGDMLENVPCAFAVVYGAITASKLPENTVHQCFKLIEKCIVDLSKI